MCQCWDARKGAHPVLALPEHTAQALPITGPQVLTDTRLGGLQECVQSLTAQRTEPKVRLSGAVGQGHTWEGDLGAVEEASPVALWGRALQKEGTARP